MNNGTTVRFAQGTVQCVSPSGLHRMAYIEWGARDNPRVLVCAHGLARNGRDFDALAGAMVADYRVVCPDIVGRGRSDWLPDAANYGIAQYVADMMVLIARLGVDSVHWLGTSMGGVIGMVLASFEGTPVSSLLLNDVGPEISTRALKRIGEYMGCAPRFGSFSEAEQYIRRVSAPFGCLTDEQWRQLTESSVRQSGDGRWDLCFDAAGIAESFRRATAAGEIDLWPIYERIRCPTLVVRGAQSDLLGRETVQVMAKRGPCPQVVEVPGVGHAPMFMEKAQIDIARRFFLAQ